MRASTDTASRVSHRACLKKVAEAEAAVALGNMDEVISKYRFCFYLKVSNGEAIGECKVGLINSGKGDFEVFPHAWFII